MSYISDVRDLSKADPKVVISKDAEATKIVNDNIGSSIKSVAMAIFSLQRNETNTKNNSIDLFCFS